MPKKTYYVYIMSNVSKTLCVGVTNDLLRRVYEHKNKLIEGFTVHYNFTHLVFFEETDDITAAIDREKQIKAWHRDWKINLIESVNKNGKIFPLVGFKMLKQVQHDNFFLISLKSMLLTFKPSIISILGFQIDEKMAIFEVQLCSL